MKKITIKVTAGELLAANEALSKLLTADMPLKSGFQVMKLIKQIGPMMEVSIESRNKVVEEFGVADSVGNVEIQPDKLSQAMPKLKELAALECEVEFDPVTLPGDIVLDVVSLVALEKFISLG